MKDLDLSADVENEKDWMRSVSTMTRTGNWPADVLAVAETQLGYKESTRNLILKGDDLKGYTRYGAWYGDPYGDWCAMYASFCLRYAGVEDYPLASNVDHWIDTLTQAGYYETSDRYTGRPGELIFFDQDQKPSAEVHFAQDGVEVLTPSTSLTEGEEAEGADTFQFTQDNFTVTGTLVGTKAVNTIATRVQPHEVDNTGNTMYVLVAQVGNRYYALSGANGGTLGGMMSYYGAANTNIPAAIGADGTALVELPETCRKPMRIRSILPRQPLSRAVRATAPLTQGSQGCFRTRTSLTH